MCTLIQEIYVDNEYDNKLHESFLCRNERDMLYYITDFNQMHIQLDSSILSNHLPIRKMQMVLVNNFYYLTYAIGVFQNQVYLMKMEIDQGELKMFYNKKIPIFRKEREFYSITDFTMHYHEDLNAITFLFHINQTSRFIIQNFSL